MKNAEIETALKNWRLILRKYQKPDTGKACVQLLNTFLPFICIWVLMYPSLQVSYGITLVLAIINACFLLRIFIIQHDCGHRSFFKSGIGNNSVGLISSVLTTVPFKSWSQVHNAHHAHNGQLEHRGLGDVFFLTTEEYQARTSWGKIHYRIFRHSFMQFMIIPVFYFTITLRFPLYKIKGSKQSSWPFLLTNSLLLLLLSILMLFLGVRQVAMVHIPILLFFWIISFWFFYVQHQQEENYKASKEQWDHLIASVRGSSYYKLPALLQWLSGNIGFHHIHHLNSRIPNYHLAACARENPILNKYVSTITFRQSLKCAKNKLWDEGSQRMISFREHSRIIQISPQTGP